MGASSCYYDALDRVTASQAGITGALVDAMLQLEESPDAICVDVIGNGRATELNRLFQNRTESEPELFKFRARESPGAAAWTDSGAKQALIGIDVSDARQQGLIQERGFDREFTSAKELCKLRRLDRQWFRAWSGESLAFAQIKKIEPAKPAGIDEAQFSSAGEPQAGMCMYCNGRVRGGDK